jgi:hydrogenase nickel incorporation protein HypA/HybF
MRNRDGKTQVVPVNLDVETVEGFSGHSDRKQILNFIKRVNPVPEKVLTCHGEASKCINLASTIHKSMNIDTKALAVTESILEITLRHADQAKARRVTDIHLVLGELASIVDDSVQFYWDLITKDTLAEGSTLHFRRIEALMECLDCSERYKPGNGQLRCPSCDGGQVRVIAGEEFRLEAIEVDSDETSDGDQA